MTSILTAAELRLAESNAIARGTDAAALMARAGAAAARAVRGFTAPQPTLVLCGPGNNGGDGYVVAAELADAGWPVRVAALDEPRADPARAARGRWTGPIEPLANATPAPLLIDALFGIGLARSLAPEVADALARLAAAARMCVALDLPSGVDADSGALLGARAHFVLTIACGALKPAHLLYPGAALCGRVVIAGIGLNMDVARLSTNSPPAPLPLGASAHKAERGHVLVLGGGPGHGGAARLCARAALRTGAGLVTIAVPSPALAENAARVDSIMLRTLDDSGALAVMVAERAARVVALGPALGIDAPAYALAKAALALDVPLVLDADVFTLFRGNSTALRRAAPTVLTPHAGEFARMFGHLPGSKVDRARAAAVLSGAVVLLKGPDTVIAHPDGRAAINSSQAPWLATAGSGDVLTGAIAARLAGGDDAFNAACAGAWLHARAGAIAGGPGLIADDLPELLGQAVRALAGGDGDGYTPAR